MQLLLDKVTASIVGVVIVTILVALQFRMQEEKVEITNLYSANKEALSFAETLERDLVNTGFGISPGDSSIIAFHKTNAGMKTITDSLIFRGVGAGGAAALIRYVASPVDSVVVDGVSMPTYQVVRSENAGAGFVDAGASPRTLLEFNIDLLDFTNNITIPSNVRKIRIRMVNAVPTGIKDEQTRTMKQVHWGVTLTPNNLQLAGYQGG